MEQKSKPLRRRPRPRRRINWAPTLALLLTANVVYACFNSKVTAIRSVNLDGVRPTERNRLDRMVQSLRGVPALKIDPRAVENSFMNESRVLSADFRRNIFGVARLMLHYRIPVASLAGSPKTYFDETGAIFFEPEPVEGSGKDLPQIKLDSKMRVSVMAISGVINYKSVAELAKLARAELTGSNKTENPIEIDVQDNGGVCLNINNGTVDLGTCEQLPEKIAKLKQVLQEHPDLFEVNSSLNLMIPERPQVIARKKDNG